jgi:hypothetical protein
LGGAVSVVLHVRQVQSRKYLGFVADEFASGLDHFPRDPRSPMAICLLAKLQRRIHALRAPDGAGKAQREGIFASGLTMPLESRSGRLDPNSNLSMSPTRIQSSASLSVGDLVSSGPAETVMTSIPTAGVFEAVADIFFSKDGARMFRLGRFAHQWRKKSCRTRSVGHSIQTETRDGRLGLQA